MSEVVAMSHSTSSNVCFNPDCAESKSERPRKGWRLRTGEYVELCDRCCSAFEEGRYCDIFHINAAGWNCCESCGKRVHCGCIVSAHAFTLLDATGIECIACTRKNAMLASNHALSPSLFYHAPLHERFKDIPIKNLNHLAGSGPVPLGQAPSLFHSPISQPELRPRMPYEVDRLNAGERLSASALEKRKVVDFSESYRIGSLKLDGQDVPENGKTGTNYEEERSSSITLSHSSLRDDSSTPQFGLHLPCSSTKETNGHIRATGIHLQATPPPPPAKQFHSNLHNGVDSAGETQSRYGRPRADGRGRSQLLSRYWPRFTDQEMQLISGNTNAIITPLFEKMLSASDAGRIGRLVLPKKCAEAYFPPISQPEGLPLKVQDSKGNEWIFQFRFWPNNNSRMYVLEGFTTCIQNMQLQAGDIVTFSRLEPEGKLFMGFRKASTAAPADQDCETSKTSNGVPLLGDVEFADPSTWSKVDKSGYIAKEALGAKSSIPRKRKSSALGLKSKRLRIENEDLIELKLTWKEAQGLLRPPLNYSPSVVVMEGFEFEEYEDAPVLGKPTLFATNDAGVKVQFVQCEDCNKWRRLPGNAVLPYKWTCSDNTDPERSSCSALQESLTDELEDLLPPCNLATSKKMKAAKQEPDNIEALEGLDTLANLAILGEGEEPLASSQATTKHPRHRPGCSCIVCIQPPSGKGPKHKQTCTCNVCQTVKRRFRTLMLRREKKQSDREAEMTRKKRQEINLPLSEKPCDDDVLPCNNTESSSSEQKKMVSDGSDDDPNKTKSSTSPFKGQIDLNIQPEREEELSPGSDSCSMMRLLQDATERYLRQRLSSSSSDKNPAGNQTPSGVGGEGTREKASNSIKPDSHQELNKDHYVPSSMKAPDSAPSTG